MRLASFEQDGRMGFGVVEGDELIDLTGIDGMLDLRSFLARGMPQAAITAAAGTAAGGKHLALAGLRLLPPLAGAGRSFWVGANYRTLRSNRDGTSPAGDYPSLFMRTPQSLAGHDAPIVRPRVSDQFDYEGEVVLVIGKGGRHISEASALDHVAGLTLANDGCLRDFMDHGRNVTAGKNFDASGAMGPWIITRDELDPARPLTIETYVNGERRQKDTTANLRFSFARLISYISGFATLLPGDMIATGSPQGAGGGPFGCDPPRWLVPGDVIEIRAGHVGTLRNIVIDEVSDQVSQQGAMPAAPRSPGE